jgi:GT2 family glycosyltransferase
MITIGILTLSEYAKQAKNVVDSINLDTNCDIVLIDNGQKNGDGVEDVDTVYYPVSNLGIPNSWNLILEMAFFNERSEDNSEIAFILNDDIVLHEECLELMVESMVNNPDNFPSAKIEPRFIPGMHFSCFAVTRHCLEVNGFFDTNYSPCFVEDTDYYHRLLQTDLKYGSDRWAKFTHNRVLDRNKPWVRQSHQKNRDYFRKKWGVPPKATFRKMAAGRKEL